MHEILIPRSRVCRACFSNATHRVFPTGGIGHERESRPLTENMLIRANRKNPPQSCFISILLSYSLYAQVMLFLILIDVQYLHVVISLEKVSNNFIPPLDEKITPGKISDSFLLEVGWGVGGFSSLVNAIWKTLNRYFSFDYPTVNFRPFSRGQSH